MRILATLVALGALGTMCASANQSDSVDGRRIPRATLEGRVTTLFGEPLPGARVVAMPKDFGAPSEIQTSKDGTFRLNDLPTGRLEVEAGMPGFEKVSVEISLHSGEVERLDLGLQLTNLSDSARCKVHGGVLDSKGRPAAGGSVAGVAAFSARVGSVGSIDGAGRYTLFFPIPAHYVVFARGFSGIPQAKVVTCRADRNTDETLDFLLPDLPR